MPTRGRREWAAEAVKYFDQQTHFARELVIIDEPEDPSFPDGIGSLWRTIVGPAIRYVREGGSIGAKRNKAVMEARGDLIAHWDSDDIYAPNRLAHQVEMFRQHPEAEIIGYHTMDFIDIERDRRFRYHLRPNYAIGVSMVYPFRTWLTRHFQDRDSGEDLAFQLNRAVYCEPADGHIVARAHGGNTSPKKFDSPVWTEVDSAA